MMSIEQSLQPNQDLPSGGASVRPNSTLPPPLQVQPAGPNAHNHWCWVCIEWKSIQRCSDFIRHIECHYTRYYCIPSKPVRLTGDVRSCGSCNTLNPDARHLNEHTHDCVGRHYTRKDPLMKHFKDDHGFTDGSALAEDSGHTEQKHFACGFCFFYFNSPKEMAKHVHAWHHNLSQTDWDPNKVILGLLSQNEQNPHWRGALAAKNHIPELLLTWDLVRVKELQQRLEMGREPPWDLVAAAINQSNYGRSEYDHIDPMPITGLTDPRIDLSQTIQAFPPHNPLSPLLSISDQGYTTHAPHTIATTLRSQDWNRIPEGRPLYQFDPQTYETSVGAMNYQVGHHLQPHTSLQSRQTLEQQYPACLPSMPPGSGIPESSGLGGNLQGVSLGANTDPRSTPMAEAYNHPTQPFAGPFPPTSTTEFASAQLTATYNPSDRPYADAQRPHQRTIDYPGFGTNSNSNHSQRSTQHQDHPQGQRFNS